MASKKGDLWKIASLCVAGRRVQDKNKPPGSYVVLCIAEQDYSEEEHNKYVVVEAGPKGLDLKNEKRYPHDEFTKKFKLLDEFYDGVDKVAPDAVIKAQKNNWHLYDGVSSTEEWMRLVLSGRKIDRADAAAYMKAKKPKAAKQQQKTAAGSGKGQKRKAEAVVADDDDEEEKEEEKEEGAGSSDDDSQDDDDDEEEEPSVGIKGKQAPAAKKPATAAAKGKAAAGGAAAAAAAAGAAAAAKAAGAAAAGKKPAAAGKAAGKAAGSKDAAGTSSRAGRIAELLGLKSKAPSPAKQAKQAEEDSDEAEEEAEEQVSEVPRPSKGSGRSRRAQVAAAGSGTPTAAAPSPKPQPAKPAASEKAVAKAAAKAEPKAAAKGADKAAAKAGKAAAKAGKGGKAAESAPASAILQEEGGYVKLFTGHWVPRSQLFTAGDKRVGAVSAEEEEGDYEVERIVDWWAKGKAKWYLVKWQGYELDLGTLAGLASGKGDKGHWEPERNVKGCEPFKAWEQALAEGRLSYLEDGPSGGGGAGGRDEDEDEEYESADEGDA